jgi:hypothetical protein
MPEQKILDAAWRSYAEAAIPIDAPDIQRVEMRRAFYGGARALFVGIMVMLDPRPDVEPTEADLRKMDAVEKELEDFARHLRQGRA